MLVSYEHLFLEIFLRTCLYYAKLCTHFKSHSHKRARTLQRGLVFRQFKLFCLQTASSIDFGQIVEPVNCMTGPSLIVIYLGFRYTDICSVQKSDNLQYNTLVCWADGTNNLSTKQLTFQVFFFHNFL